MHRKKILHFVSGLEVGGTETQLLRIVPLLQEDLDNRVCCFSGRGPIGKLLEEKGVKVYYLDFKGRRDVFVYWRFGQVLREYKPDILVTYLIHCDLIGRFLGRIFGVKKIVCSQRGSLLQWEFLRFFDRLTTFLVTKYLVQTEVAKLELSKKLAIPEDRFFTIPNGIDLNEYDFPLDQEKKKLELGIPIENNNIVCVSKLRRGKGHKYLLGAFENLYKERQDINLLIVGDGEKRNDLNDQIKDYRSKSNIYFLGDRNDVKEILRISDIFVLPTLGEGMSNALLEAMASRKAIITTDIPQNKEMLTDGISAIFVPKNNSVKITDSLLLLISNTGLEKELANNAYTSADKVFSINTIKRRVSNFLSSL